VRAVWTRARKENKKTTEGKLNMAGMSDSRAGVRSRGVALAHFIRPVRAASGSPMVASR